MLHAEWTELPLEDCMDKLIDYRGKTPQKTSVGIPLVTAKIVKGGRIARPTEFIAEADYVGWMRRGIPNIGDVLVTTEAPLGEVAQLASAQVALAQRLIALRGKAGLLDNTYLRFLMQSEFVQNQLVARASGTTVFGIKQSELRKIKLRFPGIPKQKAIANILGTLDDKIELNRRTNETLESIARAIFKSWFVDFDPVRAKLERNADEQQSSASAYPMPAEVYDLFPSAFQDSELGKIPEGWEVKPVSSAFDINPKRVLKKGVEAKYLDMKNVPTRGHRPDQVTLREFKSGTKFENGDTLLARITPCLENGKTAFVDFLNEGEVAGGSTEFIIVRPKAPLPDELGYLLARDESFRAHAIQNMVGTSGRQRVLVDCFDHIDFVTPDEAVAVEFGRIVKPLFSKIKAASLESETLAQLRDTLLPKLLSGELTVPDALLKAEEVL